MRSTSLRDICFGLQTTPPFAPPKGMPINAHFHVIHIASALTSSSVPPRARLADVYGERDDADLIRPRREQLPVGPAPRQPERVPARKHVAQARKRPHFRSIAAPELDVEPADRPELGPPADVEHTADV